MKDTLPPEILLRIRAAHDLTQTDLAGRLGVSRATVSNWERGVFTVSSVKAMRMRQLWPEECHESAPSE